MNYGNPYVSNYVPYEAGGGYMEPSSSVPMHDSPSTKKVNHI
jgi:hypothetical protein